MSSGRIGLPDVYRDEDDPRFFAPHGNCLICKRPLGIPSDPDSLDCGGDCWGCIREIEDIEGIMEDHETFEVAARYSRPAEEESVGNPPAKETGHKPPSVSPALSSPAVVFGVRTHEEVAAGAVGYLGPVPNDPAEIVKLYADLGVRLDPNADLVGFEIPNVGTVTGTCAWSDGQYVRVITEGERDTCRVAAHVRALRG